MRPGRFAEAGALAALAATAVLACWQASSSGAAAAVGRAALFAASPSAYIDYLLTGGEDGGPEPYRVWLTDLVPEPSEQVTDSLSPLLDLETALALIPEERRGPIEELQYLSNPTGDLYFKWGAGTVRNSTSMGNAEAMEAANGEVGFDIELDSDEPQVLIMHTHTTESFDRFDAGFYDSEYPTRSTDDTINMVAVGDAAAKALNEAGINTVHSAAVHDYPAYNNSYSRSAVTVNEYLAKYPSIKVVLDLHRDGLEREDGTRIKPVAVIDGKKAAQIMIISGADDGTMDMPNYLENLKLAVRLQSSIESLYPGLTRPVLFDYRRYNQDLTTGSLLIEIGSHGNTLAEAVYSGELVGKAVAQALRELH